MNVGTYIQPTNRGQIVIPAQFRKNLGIDGKTLLLAFLFGDGIFLRPVETMTKVAGSDALYLETLKKNRGAWGPETSEDKKRDRAQRKLELAESKKNRNAW